MTVRALRRGTMAGRGAAAGSGALTEASLTANVTTTDATSFTTASITTTVGSRVLVWVFSINPSVTPTPTVSGNGITWSQVATAIDAGGTAGATLFSGVGNGNTGTLTLDFAADSQVGAGWVVHEFIGATGTPAVRQSKVVNTGTAASFSVTLDNALGGTTSSYATVLGVNKLNTSVFVPGTDFTERYQGGINSGGTFRQFVEFDIAPTDAVCDCTWTTNITRVAVAAEIGNP